MDRDILCGGGGGGEAGLREPSLIQPSEGPGRKRPQCIQVPGKALMAAVDQCPPAGPTPHPGQVRATGDCHRQSNRIIGNGSPGRGSFPNERGDIVIREGSEGYCGRDQNNRYPLKIL